MSHRLAFAPIPVEPLNFPLSRGRRPSKPRPSGWGFSAVSKLARVAASGLALPPWPWRITAAARGLGPGSQRSPALPQTPCVPLGKTLSCSVPRLPLTPQRCWPPGNTQNKGTRGPHGSDTSVSRGEELAERHGKRPGCSPRARPPGSARSSLQGPSAANGHGLSPPRSSAPTCSTRSRCPTSRTSPCPGRSSA